MKLTVKLITETQPGTLIEEEVLTIERADLITPAMVGLSIAEGKAIMELLQRQLVTAQVQRHGASIEHIPALRKLGNLLLDTIRLELNADSLPDYGSRFRTGTRISTGFAESAVNEIIAK